MPDIYRPSSVKTNNLQLFDPSPKGKKGPLKWRIGNIYRHSLVKTNQLENIPSNNVVSIEFSPLCIFFFFMLALLRRTSFLDTF